MSGFIQLGANELSIGERDGTVFIPVTRTGDTSHAVTVEYRLDSETAIAGQDFTAQTGVILTTTIAAGAGSVLIPVPIINDTQSEATETFTISIVNIDSGTLLTPRTGRISILDDESPVTPPVSPPLLSDYNVQMQPVISGLAEPIDIDFSPIDPSIGYVATKGGKVIAYDFDPGTGAVTQLSTVLDISAKVNDYQDRGLLGVALHPDLANNPYLYAFYVVDPADTAGKTGNAGPDGGGNRYSYLSRFTLDADGLGVVPGSEVVLVGGAGQSLASVSGNGTIDSASSISTPSSEINPATGQYIQDFLKVDSRSHAGGGLAFGPDGMLYVSVGDGTSYNFADPRTISVQSVDSLSGKILRIDPLTGDGLPDNPFYQPGTSLDSNSAKVYQLGLRNPFRLAFDDEGRLFMSETGWNTYEEINSGGPGANFGWPYFEGGDGGVSIKTLQYPAVLPNSAAFYAAVNSGSIVITAPFRAFNHQDSAPGYQSNVIVGGSGFLDGPNYPGSLQNSYLFSNFDKGQIFAVDVNNRQDLAYLATTTSGYGPTEYVAGPDGYIYTADLISGTISRLLITEKGATEADVVYRWAAGSTTVAAIDGGPNWTADASVVKGGPTQTFAGGITKLHASVAATTPSALFNNERYDEPTGAEMGLDFGNDLAPGTYAVRLFLANTYDGTKTVGSRVFDIRIENQLAFDDVDLVKLFGHQAGGMLTWQGQVVDGTIDIDFVHGVENPLINGVEVLRVGPPKPAVTLTASPTAGSETAGTVITLTATASAAVDGPQTVALSFSGTGITAGDFTGTLPTSITIPNGATSASVTVKIADDALVEGPETATFTISSPSSGVTLGATTTANVSITDNDAAPVLPTVSLTANPGSGSETAGTEITLTVTASAAVTGPQTVALALSGGGVSASDFVGTLPTSISIPNGATSASVTVKVADDALVEGLETATFTISNPSSGVILGGTTSANFAIADNDAPAGPQVLYRWAAGGVTVAATDGGPAWTADTSVVNGGPTETFAGGITSLHASAAGAAPLALFANERWDPATGAEMGLDFGSGLAAGTYAVRVFMGNGYDGTKAVGARVFDIRVENQLAFDDVDLVKLFGHKKGGMLSWEGAVTDGTVDIDFAHVKENPLVNGIEVLYLGPVLPKVTLAAAPGVGSEAGGTEIKLTVTASAPVDGPQVVALSLDGTGVTPGDFTGTIPSSITIPNGATSATVTLNVADDALIEGVETARFTISAPSSGIALGATTSANVAITDNDAPAAPEVLFRWAAGNTTVAATDGGPAWTADASVVKGGPTEIFAGGITGLHGSAAGKAPLALFANERWDPATGAEMGLDFGSGLADGTYTVRLFMGNGYDGTKTAGSRVFDVLIEDQLIFDNVDLISRFGHKNGGMLEWTGTVDDGTVDIDFAHAVENPLINGVEILLLA